ncbi:MAG TPA: hypothetical protein VEK77_06800 [Gemmatimonadales bacterium]|nr:hypothetical protein [Gemmatimonadales bacterium]
MPLDPEALLTIAVDLVTARPGGASEQSCWRTAMNRSYYACLLLLIKRIDQVNGAGTVPPYNTHHWVRSTLHDSKRAHLMNIKQKLCTLRLQREQADYVINRPDFLRGDMEEVLGRAQRLFAEVRDRVPDALLRGLPVK